MKLRKRFTLGYVLVLTNFLCAERESLSFQTREITTDKKHAIHGVIQNDEFLGIAGTSGSILFEIRDFDESINLLNAFYSELIASLIKDKVGALKKEDVTESLHQLVDKIEPYAMSFEDPIPNNYKALKIKFIIKEVKGTPEFDQEKKREFKMRLDSLDPFRKNKVRVMKFHIKNGIIELWSFYMSFDLKEITHVEVMTYEEWKKTIAAKQ